MTKNQKYILGIVVVIVALILVFRKQIMDWLDKMNNGRSANRNTSADIMPPPSEGSTCTTDSGKSGTIVNGSCVPIAKPILVMCNPNRPGYDVNGFPNINCANRPMPPSLDTCDNLKGQINAVKAKMNVYIENGQSIDKIKPYLDNLIKQYNDKGCVGPPPPPNLER